MILRQRVFLVSLCENLEEFLKIAERKNNRWLTKQEIDQAINKICGKKLGRWNIYQKAECLRVKFLGCNDARIIEEILKPLSELFYVEVQSDDKIYVYRIGAFFMVGGKNDEQLVY